MKQHLFLTLIFLLVLCITDNCQGQNNQLQKRHPLGINLKGNTTPLKGYIRSNTDTSLSLVPVRRLSNKYSPNQIDKIVYPEINVAYEDIQSFTVVHAFEMKPEIIAAGIGAGLVVGGVIGYHTSKSECEGLDCLVTFGLGVAVNIIGTVGGAVLGGLMGGIIGANILVKESEKIEFIPDPNSIETQRAMVSKLIYK